jgi:hypothetical protein
MAEPYKKPVTLEELLVSSLAQTDALAKLLIDNARRVYAEDFGGTGDVSKATESSAAMNNRRRVGPLLICVFVFLQCLGVPALGSATTIVAVRTPTDIYLGADSRVTGARPDGTVYYEVKCKIGQVGKIFFAAAGPYEYERTGLNIRLLLIEAQHPGASVVQTVERFETFYADALTRTSRNAQKESPMVYKKYFLNRHVYVYFFAFENGIPQYFGRIFTIQSSNDPLTVGIEQNDCPPGCSSTKPTILGIGYADVMKKLSSNAWTTRPPIQVINEVIEASIREDPDHTSGGPIDILHMNKEGPRWVQKKKECAEIQ